MADKLLIFDCDGTLVDSEGIANKVFVGEVQNLGVPLTEAEAWEHFPGTSLALCMEYVTRNYGFEFPEDFITQYRTKQKIVFAEELQPIKGINEVLAALGGAKCVASNGPMDIIRQNLKTTQLLPYFQDRIFSAYVLQKWKPLPDLFLHAAENMKYAPEHCIVIEDSDAGIQAGLNAGMTVLAYTGGHQHYDIDARDAITFNNMSELPSLLNQLV